MTILPLAEYNNILQHYRQSSFKKNLEIEVRFSTRLIRGVEKILPVFYYRLLNYLEKTPLKRTSINSVDVIYSNRKNISRYTLSGESVVDAVSLNKNTLYTNVIKAYNMRVAVSEEFTNNISKDIDDESYQQIRTKKRHSFYIHNYRIDCTQVHNKMSTGETYTNYEVELEVLRFERTTHDEMNKIITAVQQYLQDTSIVYSNTVAITCFDQINNILKNPKNIQEIPISSLSVIRALEYDDCVAGGLIPLMKGKVVNAQLANTQGVKYGVTIKADGKRKLLYLNGNGIFFISAPKYINMISSINPYERLNGTLIEGELIETGDKSFRYLMYDLLNIGENRNVRDLPLVDRLDRVRQLENEIHIKGLKLETKEYKFFSSAEELFSSVNEILNATYDFETDGLIFTPDAAYVSGEVEQNSLVVKNAVCKWKKQEMNTIDFQLKYTADGVQLLIGENIPFEGTENIPFDYRTNVDQEWFSKQPSYDDLIVEMKWNFERNLFEFYRLRPEKLYPNGEYIAKQTWTAIFTGVDEETLRGRSYQLSRRWLERRPMFLWNERVRDQKFDVLFVYGKTNLKFNIPTQVVTEQLPIPTEPAAFYFIEGNFESFMRFFVQCPLGSVCFGVNPSYSAYEKLPDYPYVKSTRVLFDNGSYQLLDIKDIDKKYSGTKNTYINACKEEFLSSTEKKFLAIFREWIIKRV